MHGNALQLHLPGVVQIESSQLIMPTYHSRFKINVGDVLVRSLLLRDDKVSSLTVCPLCFGNPCACIRPSRYSPECIDECRETEPFSQYP